MKYLKRYEEIDRQPEAGDYVVCEDRFSKTLNYYLSENIGRILIKDHIAKGVFNIEYNDNMTYYINYQYFNLKNRRTFRRDEIIFFSENRQDCEAFLNSKKYNI